LRGTRAESHENHLHQNLENIILIVFFAAFGLGFSGCNIPPKHEKVALHFCAYSTRRLLLCFTGPNRRLWRFDYLWLDPECESSEHQVRSRGPLAALQKELGDNYQIIEEGLDGRTTDARDPGSPISGAQLDGSAYLPACLASHLPVDLVVIMLGTNDLKPVFNRTPLRIAIGAAHLIDLVNTLNGGVGTTYKNPKVLLICPPPLNPEIEKGPVFGEMFKGGVEKSQKLSELYEAVAKMGGAEFLNAGSVISTDGVDGLHLTAESERKLGVAVAAKVKEMCK
jgi:lysophospholipase L1-like esterase